VSTPEPPTHQGHRDFRGRLATEVCDAREGSRVGETTHCGRGARWVIPATRLPTRPAPVFDERSSLPVLGVSIGARPQRVVHDVSSYALAEREARIRRVPKMPPELDSRIRILRRRSCKAAECARRHLRRSGRRRHRERHITSERFSEHSERSCARGCVGGGVLRKRRRWAQRFPTCVSHRVLAAVGVCRANRRVRPRTGSQVGARSSRAPPAAWYATPTGAPKRARPTCRPLLTYCSEEIF
jgi:hypothetical protein